jgi:hypothetical protein
LRIQIGAFGPRGGVGRLDQGGSQEAITLAGLARRPFAGAFMDEFGNSISNGAKNVDPSEKEKRTHEIQP